MGQVPAVNVNTRAASHQILLIGDGRLAKALATLGVASQWSRNSGDSLAHHLSTFRPTHIWLAISDGSLKIFVQEHAALLSKISTDGAPAPVIIHFAGSLPTFTVANITVHAVHPLMSFSNSSSESTMASAFSKAPLILDNDGPSLETLMPGCTNSVHRIDPAQRPYYHALCAIAGNFSVLLWESVADRFQNMGIPATALDAYREQIFKNLAGATTTTPRPSVLTGPLSRGDTATLQAHRASLLERAEIPLLKIYDGFSDLFRTDRERTPMKRNKT